MIKSVLTLRTGNAWVHALGYHAVAPHVIVIDTPLVVSSSVSPERKRGLAAVVCRTQRSSVCRAGEGPLLAYRAGPLTTRCGQSGSARADVQSASWPALDEAM